MKSHPINFKFAFIVFLGHKNIGFVTLLGRFGHVLTELYLKNEFCIIAELICISLGYFRWPNQLFIAFVLFLDPDILGFVTELASLGHVFTELCLKTEFRIMAELICILLAKYLWLNNYSFLLLSYSLTMKT